jgi:hypothetical protein
MIMNDKYSRDRWAILWVRKNISTGRPETKICGEIRPENGIRFDTYATKEGAAAYARAYRDYDWQRGGPAPEYGVGKFSSAYIMASISSRAFQSVFAEARKTLRENANLNG